MEINLSLEKTNLELLLKLHKVAEEYEDVSLADFLEGEMIQPQVEDIRTVSRYVSELRRIGKGLGVLYFDRELAEKIDPRDITIPIGSVRPDVHGSGPASGTGNFAL